jgi:transcriptional regulator with XRE-family HTH domain
MNITIFTQRLQECRRRKYSSQQAFADAYMERFGMIRQGKKKIDNNMFGTIQSWEQGKSTPSADVLANICELLDCDADYLLGRINQRTHDIADAHRYTGLSSSALEQLHEYRMALSKEPNWEEIRKLEENWSSHKYYRAYALYLIDALLTGSKTHKLSIGILDRLFQMIYEEGIGINKEDYGNDDEYEDEETDNRELWAAQTREQIDIITYLITNNIRDILYENAVDEKLPDALRIDTTNGTYFFSIYD